jgi:amino acid adenylation domain-containing protein
VSELPALKALLEEIDGRGLRIGVAGSDLRLQGPKDRMDPALLARIKAAKADLVAYLGSEAASAGSGFGLTLLQRGYLIGRGEAIEMGNVASHVYHEIEGCWDLDRLERTLRSVVDRHGMLRTRFTDDGRQVEEPSTSDVRIDVLDLRGQPEATQRAQLAGLREERSHRILPADRAPMLVAEVTLLADDRMVLHVGHDGLVMDGISMFLFFRDWFAAYSGEPAPETEEASFEAYVAALETARTRAPAVRSRQYWMARIEDLAPHPDLPLAASPAAITTPRFSQHVARLDKAAWTAAKARAQEAGVTPTVLLMAAYAEVLDGWGAGPRFTLTTTLANRPPIHPRIFDAIGNFSETMLIEIAPDRDCTFEERAVTLQAQMRKDIDNRHFSGIEVLRELGRRNGTSAARMPYTFNSTIGYNQADLDGSTLELFGPEVYTSSQTPQVWLNGFAFEQHGGVVVQFDSVVGLFPPGLVEAMVAGYQTLLDQLTEPDPWSARQFDLLPEGQRDRRRAANLTSVQRDRRLAQDRFVAMAESDPDAVALITSAATFSYGELYRRACEAATWLRSWKVERDELVGLVMQRGPEQIVSILATVMAGGAYLPIDAGLPIERQRYMLRDGRVHCVLTNVAISEPLGDDLEIRTVDASAPVDDAAIEDYLEAPGAEDEDLAYVLYTSGTTGEPKGVMVSHRSVVNLVDDCNHRFTVGAEDRFFNISAFNFDLSVYDVFGALSAGAAIVLPDHDQAADPAHWLALATGAGVTVWNSVPAIVGLLHDQARSEGSGLPPTLRLVMMSGDRISPELPGKLRALKDDLTLMSLGGPTETTIWNISHPIPPDHDGGTIPYGRPNANNRAYILDAADRDAPDWVTGEIAAAGTGLARGYWADPARTAERFFDDDRRGERLFRTGDLGRFLPDGTIEILGRRDFQIKVNGYRIEAGEVETRLVAIEGIKQAVVVRQTSSHGDRLVAHLVADSDEQVPDELIRKELRRYLPEYMTPAAFGWQASLPLTGNGKVDRQTLGKMTAAAASGSSAADPGGPMSPIEQQVATVWASVLHADESAIGPTVTLPDLGGDSLAAVRILTGVRKQFGVGITLDQMYEVETVRLMAAHIEAVKAES